MWLGCAKYMRTRSYCGSRKGALAGIKSPGGRWRFDRVKTGRALRKLGYTIPRAWLGRVEGDEGVGIVVDEPAPEIGQRLVGEELAGDGGVTP